MNRARFATAWAVLLAGFVLLASRYMQASIDDLFIILRYVENAAGGHGLVFNIGERVEGYTCFGWVISLVALVRLGWPAYWAAKFVGMLCSAGTLLLCYGIGRELWHGEKGSRAVAFLPALLLAVNPDFLYWSVSGLETSLYTVSVMIVLYLLVIESRYAREQHLSRWLTVVAQALFCTIAILTRPEGLVLLAYAFIVKLVMWGGWREWLRYCLVLGVFTAVPVVIFFLWRHQYYGEWLPITYAAKMHGLLLDRLGSARHYVFGFLASNCFGWLGAHGQSALPGLVIFMMFPVAALFAVRRKRAHLVVLGWVIISIAVIVVEGGDWMPHYRFFVPVLAGFMLLISHSAVAAIARAKECRHVFCRPAVIVLVAVVFITLLGDAIRRNMRHPRLSSIEQPDRWPTVFSRYILESSPTGTLAASDIGLIGYITHYRIIDMAGLVDKHIAHSFGNSFQKDYDIAYVLDQNPDFIVLTSQRCLAEDRMRVDARFINGYQFIKFHDGHSLYMKRRADRGVPSI